MKKKIIFSLLMCILLCGCSDRYSRTTTIIDHVIFTTVWDTDYDANKRDILYSYYDTIFKSTPQTIKEHQRIADSLVEELNRIEEE